MDEKPFAALKSTVAGMARCPVSGALICSVPSQQHVVEAQLHLMDQKLAQMAELEKSVSNKLKKLNKLIEGDV
jgi:hypothetical protein